MRTQLEHKSFEVIAEGKKILSSLYEKYPELSDLEACVNSYSKAITPDLLSRCATEMSVLLCRIGELVAELKSNANEAYIYRKFRYIWEYNVLKKDMTQKQRENLAMEQSFDYYKQELINRFVADFISAKYEDYQRFVNVVQSRLRIMKNEEINANYQV